MIVELFRIFGTVGVKVDEASQALDQVTTKAKSTSDTIGTRFQKVGNTMQAVGGKFKGASLVASGALAYSASQASDFEENINKVDVAFGKNSAEVKKWSNTATKQFGLSKNAALEMTAQFGDMGTSMGLSQAEASKMSMSMAGLAGDLASFKNISVDQAMTALNGVFTGETESLKTLGIVMTETNLEKFASDCGLVYKEMSEAEKVQLRYNYVMEKTKNAQGDYARTSDGTANSIRTFKASVENLAVTFGQYVLPVITPFIQKGTELLQMFNKLPTGVKKTIVAITGIIAVLSPALIIGGKVVSGIGTLIESMGKIDVDVGKVTGGMSKLFDLLAANPIVLVIAGIVALAAAFIYLWNHSESFRNFWISLWNNIKSIVTTAWNAIKTAVTTVVNAIKTVITTVFNAIKTAITLYVNAYKTVIITAWNGIKTVVTTVVNAIRTVIVTVFNAIKSTISTIMNGIKSTIISVWNSIRSGVSNAVNGVKSVVSSGFNAIKSTTSRVWNGIKTAIINPISAAKNKVSRILSAIKNMFPLSVGKIFSNLKLPHIKVSGGSPPFGIGGKGSLPKFSVSWYKKAMDNPYMFTSPTMFDYNPVSGAKVAGEAGDEMMYGHDNLMRDIETAVANRTDTNDELESIVSAFFAWMQSPNGLAKVVTDVLTDNVKFMLDDRQVGKVVRQYAG